MRDSNSWMRRLAVGAGVGGLLLAACGGDEAATDTETGDETAAEEGSPVTLSLVSSFPRDAEVFRDAAFVLSPTTREELDRGLEGLGAAGLLDGVRGRPPLDREALHVIVAAVGNLMEGEPDVAEVDCNPVMVVRGAPVVVDALATQRDRT